MMVLDERNRLHRTATVLWRCVFPLIAVLSAILGYIGFDHHLAGQDEFAHDTWDLLYYDFQLFVLGSPPLDNGGDFPLSLQVARFAAPAVTVYAVIEAVRLLFAEQLVHMGARRSRGHAVVCGDSLVARSVTEQLFAAGRRVVRMTAPGERASRHRHLFFLPGDQTSVGALRGAGVHRADELYVCAADAAQDLAVVLAATQLRRRRRRPMKVHVQIDDPELCLGLQARRLGVSSADGLEVDFFNWHELSARTLVAERPPPVHGQRPTRVMVIGASWFGLALMVELARHWRLHRPEAADRLEVVVVDDDAAAVVTRLGRMFPIVNDACRFTSYDRQVSSLLDGDLPEGSPDQVFLCCEDERMALKLAVTMDHFWRAGPQSVLVRLSRLGGLARAFAGPGDRLLDTVSDKLHPFDALRAGSDLASLAEGLTERLARAIHQRYLYERTVQGVALGSSPAMCDWPVLPETIKAANRAQAADVGPKLHAIGCALAPIPVWGPPEVLDSETIESLAIREHDRWWAYMVSTGWSYGAVRDDGAWRHPDMISWETLSEDARAKDREAVRGLPDLLSDAGFRIVRVKTETLAP